MEPLAVSLFPSLKDIVQCLIDSNLRHTFDKTENFLFHNRLAPQVTNVTHYEIEDFDGAKMDCYLVAVAANIAHWVDEEAEQGAIDGQLFLFVDPNTAITVDSITTDAMNVQHDTMTEQGRATYLLWMYGNIQNGLHSGNYLNNEEMVTEMTAAEIEAINDALIIE